MRTAADLSDAQRGHAQTPEQMQPPFTRVRMGSADFGGKSVEYVKTIYTKGAVAEAEAQVLWESFPVEVEEAAPLDAVIEYLDRTLPARAAPVSPEQIVLASSILRDVQSHGRRRATLRQTWTVLEMRLHWGHYCACL